MWVHQYIHNVELEVEVEMLSITMVVVVAMLAVVAEFLHFYEAF